MQPSQPAQPKFDFKYSGKFPDKVKLIKTIALSPLEFTAVGSIDPRSGHFTTSYGCKVTYQTAPDQHAWLRAEGLELILSFYRTSGDHPWGPPHLQSSQQQHRVQVRPCFSKKPLPSQQAEFTSARSDLQYPTAKILQCGGRRTAPGAKHVVPTRLQRPALAAVALS